jgi:hypothetical protein
MNIIKKESGRWECATYDFYTFDTGHQLRKWGNGRVVGYTPRGNFTTQLTLHKLADLAAEYEKQGAAA